MDYKRSDIQRASRMLELVVARRRQLDDEYLRAIVELSQQASFVPKDAFDAAVERMDKVLTEWAANHQAVQLGLQALQHLTELTARGQAPTAPPPSPDPPGEG